VRFSPAPVSSGDFEGIEESVVFTVVDASPAESEEPPPSLPSFGGDPELPNILFSRPPWEEKLLLLLPATFADFATCLVRRPVEEREVGGRRLGAIGRLLEDECYKDS
jgi:hypothetical protein